MSFGLSTNGFSLKRLPDIKSEMETSFRSVFGQIDVLPDSVAGQLIGVLCKPITDIWEQMELVYYSQYPNSADGVSLDYAVTLTGISRKPSTFSTGRVGMKGDVGTVVLSGTQFKTLITGTFFQTLGDVTLTNIGLLRAYITIDKAYDFADYTVSINYTNYTYHGGFGETQITIAENLVITLAGVLGLTVLNTGNGTLYITSPTDFDLSVSAIMTAPPYTVYNDAISFSNPVEVQALERGALTAPVGSITVIVNAISGFSSVNNYEDILAGNNIESDSALRLRRLTSLQITGGGNLEAIKSRIAALDGVKAAFVYENTSDEYRDEDGNLTVPPSGLPPHSMELLIDAPDTTEQKDLIANTLWQCKPAGIYTYGTTLVTITDSQQRSQPIRFSYPYLRSVLFYITVTFNSSFPADGKTQIKNAIVAYGNSLEIGEDLIYQEFYTQIYKIPGVLTAIVTVMLPKSPTYNTLIPAGLANLTALLVWLRNPATGGNLSFSVASAPPSDNNGYFINYGTYDTTDTKMAIAKGGALVAGDVFKFTNVVTPAIAYVGNLANSGGYIQPVSGFFGISGNERMIFDNTYIQGLS